MSKLKVRHKGGDILSKVIYHWGIKGMKWGVRRYQNSDGSLTPAGKKRYSDSPSSTTSPSKKKFTSSQKTDKKDEKEVSEQKKKKSISEMTDAELNEAINRLNLEKRYAELLSRSEPSAKSVSKGRKFVEDLIEKSIVPGIQEGLKTSVSSTISTFIKKQVDQALKEPNAKASS